jgi:hypothetical protein
MVYLDSANQRRVNASGVCSVSQIEIENDCTPKMITTMAYPGRSLSGAPFQTFWYSQTEDTFASGLDSHRRDPAR